MQLNSSLNLCWLRRDLRIEDNHALSQALNHGPTTLVFVFDEKILGSLNNKTDPRVSFIYDSLIEIETKLNEYGSSLIILYGDPVQEIPRLAQDLKVTNVFCNRDYEPYAKERDRKVSEALSQLSIKFNAIKDSVIFEKNEVLSNTLSTYKVFTPYKNKWIEKITNPINIQKTFSSLYSNLNKFENPRSIKKHNWYNEIGFIECQSFLPGGRLKALERMEVFKAKVSDYHINRDYPYLEGTSLLSPYIRHGNVSIREVLSLALEVDDQGHRSWLNEIVWRDFYQMILDVYPRVIKGSFRPEYDLIKYLGKEEHYLSWTLGKTGFPIIDAAMRCLNATGAMPNRLRMVCASFLCKTLLVDWKKGEKYFAEKLLDFDLAANNGGWQWCSSSGCDPQPYFRIFNPYTQSEKFDSSGVFIRFWVPELRHLMGKEIHRPNKKNAPEYIVPIVHYESSRVKCLEMYQVVKNI